jgi:hypothetical protein
MLLKIDESWEDSADDLELAAMLSRTHERLPGVSGIISCKGKPVSFNDH